jgi:hypothetical protein
MLLHVQNPELFNLLSVIAESISNATSHDDIAEVRRHISCDMEQLADMLN